MVSLSNSEPPASPAIKVSSSSLNSSPAAASSQQTRRQTPSMASLAAASKTQDMQRCASNPESPRVSRKTAQSPRRSSTTSKSNVPAPLLDSGASLSASKSRCTSPKSSRDALGSAPPSPSRSLTSADTSAGLFERDVEFPLDHMRNAQEAQDVAIPPVLTEAAQAITADDVPPEEVQSMIRTATSSSPLTSLGHRSPGWVSPVQPTTGALDGAGHSSDTGSPSGTPSHVRNTSLPLSHGSPILHPQPMHSPSGRRSAAVSPSRQSQHGIPLERAGSPMSSTLSTSPPDSALFTPSTSPSPPPTSFPMDAVSASEGMKAGLPSGPTQTISERMKWASNTDDEAQAAVSATALGYTEPPPVKKPPLRPEVIKSSTDALQLPGGFPNSSAASFSTSQPSSPMHMQSGSDTEAVSLHTADGNPSSNDKRNRRLSFMSYADIINSERAEADLTMTANGGNMNKSLSMHQLWHDIAPAERTHLSPADEPVSTSS